MAIPFPVVNLAGMSPQQVAELVARNIYWIARWSDEIVNDTNVDLKKLIQLAYGHCRWYMNTVPSSLPSSLVLAINSRFQGEGFVWPAESIEAESNILKAECTTFFNFVSGNLPPEYSNYATLVRNSDGSQSEDPIIISPKPAALQTRVQALRGVFV